VAELRIVHAQLVGWLEGLWGGIRLTLMLRNNAEVGPPNGLAGGEDDGSYL
jgi:hypothetical protein